jgi:hypothetical protein
MDIIPGMDIIAEEAGPLAAGRVPQENAIEGAVPIRRGGRQAGS